MKLFMRLLREPLFHFLIFGGLLFALFTAVSGPAPTPVNSIVVTPERVTQLGSSFEAVRRRPPTDQELRALVDSFVREEVYYREALALGMDRDDTIIRRRLQQKMEFLTDTGAGLIEPQAGELETYYQANVEKFQDAPAIALTQVFLGQNPAPERIDAALTSLMSDAESDPLLWSEPTLLPSQMVLSTIAEIDGVFGAGFFNDLMQLPTQVWTGPVESGYGLHLVRINASEPARIPPFDEVRDAIVHEWRSVKSKELREAVYTRLLERYTVVLPDGVAPKIQ